MAKIKFKDVRFREASITDAIIEREERDKERLTEAAKSIT